MDTARHRGFTLLEMVVALAVLVMATAVAVPAFRGAVPGDDDVARAARSLGAALRAARDSAVRGGMPVTVVLDSASATAWLDASRGPGPAIALELPPGVRLRLPEARARMTFGASGGGFGGPLVLDGVTGHRVLTVDRWTGDVVVR